MSQPKNTMEIFQFLNKSNCQECGKKTCLSFAAAVFQGQKEIRDCPYVDEKIIEKFSNTSKINNVLQENQEAFMEEMRKKIAAIDLSQAEERTGGKFDGEKLTFKILGKNFSIDTKGNFHTDIHVNPWVAAPVFNYILSGKGLPVSGKWLSFRELNKGKERYPLFRQRCEKPMKRIADIYTDLFDDIVTILNGKEVEKQFKSDISVVMHTLPKVPIMICYWAPDDGLDSSLNIYFDETADQNLDIGSIFSLAAGLTQMFTKMALTHGYDVAMNE